MKKDGFISTALVYSVIITFILIMLSLLSSLAFRNRIMNIEINEVKEELNAGYE